jgi:hypothetical protein
LLLRLAQAPDLSYTADTESPCSQKNKKALEYRKNNLSFVFRPPVEKGSKYSRILFKAFCQLPYLIRQEGSFIFLRMVI